VSGWPRARALRAKSAQASIFALQQGPLLLLVIGVVPPGSRAVPTLVQALATLTSLRVHSGLARLLRVDAWLAEKDYYFFDFS